ncbi:hypothetical protein C8F01DRAFT_122200 [Mycena amicta]|nr:hypothetical protein C8F01DRAFT_122200 [Mycena amicta]
MTLPLEIQERILDYLHNDLATLEACSLVCRAWRPTTSTHLFVLFKLRIDEDTLSLSRCQTFTKDFGHLTRYIRELDIQDGLRVLHIQNGVGLSELAALCVLLNETRALRRISLSTFCDGVGTARRWASGLDSFKISFSDALSGSSAESLTHLLLDGFILTVADLKMFRGLKRLAYLGLERLGVASEKDSDESDNTVPATDEYALETLSLYFIFSGPENGVFVKGIIAALGFSHVTHLRIAGLTNITVLEALPTVWLSNVTHLALELTNLDIHHPGSTLAPNFIAKVPTFSALLSLELSIHMYASVDQLDISPLARLLDNLLPESFGADSDPPPQIITTVSTYGPPVYIPAVRAHYLYCLSRAPAERVKIRWEDGNLAVLSQEFPELFADGTMEVGKFRTQRWISW